MDREQRYPLEKLRILVDSPKGPRKLCKLSFTNKDASLYITPYTLKRIYHCRALGMDANELSQTVNYTEGLRSEQEPKLSIHQSGRIHIQANKVKLPATQIGDITLFRGEHIASVSCDYIDALPLHERPLKEAGRERDHLVPVDDGVRSCRIAIYVNGKEPQFGKERVRIKFSLCRSTLKEPLHYGIATIAQVPIGAESVMGSTVIAGWDPRASSSDPIAYLLIRGE